MAKIYNYALESEASEAIDDAYLESDIDVNSPQPNKNFKLDWKEKNL